MFPNKPSSKMRFVSVKDLLRLYISTIDKYVQILGLCAFTCFSKHRYEAEEVMLFDFSHFSHLAFFSACGKQGTAAVTVAAERGENSHTAWSFSVYF